jgi:glycosyltransferase involved in cell wall biosynthesis
MKPISLAIPTHNRYEMVLECIADVVDDPRVGEIVLSDDCSDNGAFEQLVLLYEHHPKVRLFRNKRNLDCYFNKQQAVERTTLEWCVLFDDDNILTKSYLDKIFSWEWDPMTVYVPEFAEPHFNYTKFAGRTFSRRNVAANLALPHFKCMLNTCNYFVHRQSYLEVWDGSVNPHTADSTFQVFNWLASGRKLFVVPGLRYFHRVHAGSHYRANHKKTGQFGKDLEKRLALMR